MTAEEGPPNGSSDSDGATNCAPPSAAVSVTKPQHSVQDETSRDEKDDGAEMKTEKKEDPFMDPRDRADVVDRDTFPETFDELCRQMTERANFLLEVKRPPLGRLQAMCETHT